MLPLDQIVLTSYCQDPYQKVAGLKNLAQMKEALMVQNHDLITPNYQHESLDTQEIGHLSLLHWYHKDQVAFNKNSNMIRTLGPNKIMYTKNVEITR